jgi:hypothetical protein
LTGLICGLLSAVLLFYVGGKDGWRVFIVAFIATLLS